MYDLIIHRKLPYWDFSLYNKKGSSNELPFKIYISAICL